MAKLDQNCTPLFTKLMEYVAENPYPFDVPGHRMGRFPNEFRDAVGIKVMQMDVNAPRGLDSLGHPHGVIKQAQALLADAYSADEAFFLVNGSTVGILAMIMATCSANEKIIMPRNVHKSAINALILSGAVPVFVNPDIDTHVGIANGVRFADYQQAIDQNLDAVAVFIINPTYFGVANELKKIIAYAHLKNMSVLVDEAHGAHFPFSKSFPLHAMAAGADLSVCSLHKTCGTLTQSSAMFLKGKRLTKNRVQTILNILQSTSPNYLLLASIDVIRKKLALEGEVILAEVIKLADYARKKLSKIPGIKVLDKEYFASRGFKHFDHSKIVIKVDELGFSGFELYNYLQQNYHIQAELAEANVLLFIFGIGIDKESVDHLIRAFINLSFDFYQKRAPFVSKLVDFTYPPSLIRPRVAFHAPKKFVPLSECLNQISGESIMAYPPGIPLVIPGEKITNEVIKMFEFYQNQGTIILTDNNEGLIKIVDIGADYEEK